MAVVAPFRGIRYNQGSVSLDDVTCPPYDVISPEDVVYYHQKHPCNFVRLILGIEQDTDTPESNRHTRAAAWLKSWREDGTLQQDPKPAIYLYRQQFDRDGQPMDITGLICAVKLAEYSEGIILPHENTLARPKSHLGGLIRKTRANLDCVYGVYDGASHSVERLTECAMTQPPLCETVDKDGVRHTIWAINEEASAAAISEFFSDKQIAIADGHHRYETALAYRNEVKGTPSEPGSDYVLMTLVNVREPDLTVLPTHRLVKVDDADILESLPERLGDLFEVRKSSPESVIDDKTAADAIGIVTAEGAWTAKPTARCFELLEGSEASRELELNVLHRLIFERVLGVDVRNPESQGQVRYTRDPAEAIGCVAGGEFDVAFLTNNIPVKTILDVAAAGERMPQKATYFYPKLISGMVFRTMD